MTIRILLADDQALLRTTFRMLIEANDDMAVVGEAADGTEAVALTRVHRPDLVLMDIRMPGTNGLDATTTICADPNLAATRVLILTTFETDEYVAKALRAGASGFLGKDVAADALLAGIRTVAAGDALLSPTATKALIARFVATPDPAPLERLTALTARELHDVVAHHLALANAQAGTAAYLARSHPDQVQRILTDLAGTTSAALREMKATVGLLRRPGEQTSPLEPAPGLDQLPALTAGFASAGLDVAVTVDGDERRLSPDVDLTAFRIVQEALTNVTKHAATGTASVRLSYAADRLTITVTNDGATKPMSPGFGLLGMRERAHSAGGHFHAGGHPGGRFTVTTDLPILT